jgi:3-hydroxybutyryl-CoA dehydrogenase
MSDFSRVGVIGAGLMGSGIAQVAAAAGYSVLLRDVNQGLIDRGRGLIERSLAKFVEKGTLVPAARDAALKRLGTTTLLEAFADCDLVIEAVTEDLALKNQLWSELGAVCPSPTIFASNTSSLPIVAMAGASGRPDRFVGLHFFNPVPLMALVEVVQSIGTSDETVSRVTGFVQRIGKQPVAAKDTPGFIVNRLLVPYMVDAVRALERGVASVADIDVGMRLGAGHPIGPLALLDLVGLDTALKVSDIMFDEFREPQYAAPPLLRRLVLAGHLGRKTGRGFYDYSSDPPRPAL